MIAAAMLREAAQTRRRRDPRPTPSLLIMIGEPWWLYDPAEFPGRSREQIVASLTVPAVESKDA